MSLVLLAALAAAPVELAVDACVAEQAPLLAQQLSLELGAPARPAASQPGPDVTSVKIWCDEALILVEVKDPTTGKIARRRIDLARASGAARRRLLAIATAELISASWLELTVRPAPSVMAVDATASEPARVAATEQVRELTAPVAKDAPRWAFSAQAHGFGLIGPQRSLGFGARLGLERELAWRVSARGELILDHAQAREALGTLSLLSGSAFLGAQLRLPGTFPVSVGLGARLGAVELRGTPDDAAATDGFSRVGPWLGAVATARLRVAPLDRAGLCLGAEAGLVLRPFLGLSSAGAPWGIDGGWLSLQLGWEFPW